MIILTGSDKHQNSKLLYPENFKSGEILVDTETGKSTLLILRTFIKINEECDGYNGSFVEYFDFDHNIMKKKFSIPNRYKKVDYHIEYSNYDYDEGKFRERYKNKESKSFRKCTPEIVNISDIRFIPIDAIPIGRAFLNNNGRVCIVVDTDSIFVFDYNSNSLKKIELEKVVPVKLHLKIK